jgi:hypothetical protein
MIKYLIALAVLLLVTGLLWPMLSRLGLGRLPGDGLLAGRGQRFGFAFTSSLLLSLAATLLFGWLW